MVYGRLVSHLIRRVLPGPYHFEADTHPAVEITLFHQADKKRVLLSLLNAQTQTPTIAVGATVRVLVPGTPKRVLRLPEQKEISIERSGPYVQVVIPSFKILAMVMLEYT